MRPTAHALVEPRSLVPRRKRYSRKLVIALGAIILLAGCYGGGEYVGNEDDERNERNEALGDHYATLEADRTTQETADATYRAYESREMTQVAREVYCPDFDANQGCINGPP